MKAVLNSALWRLDGRKQMIDGEGDRCDERRRAGERWIVAEKENDKMVEDGNRMVESDWDGSCERAFAVEEPCLTSPAVRFASFESSAKGCPFALPSRQLACWQNWQESRNEV